jgi:hypothetical protein
LGLQLHPRLEYTSATIGAICSWMHRLWVGLLLLLRVVWRLLRLLRVV